MHELLRERLDRIEADLLELKRQLMSAAPSASGAEQPRIIERSARRTQDWREELGKRVL